MSSSMFRGGVLLVLLGCGPDRAPPPAPAADPSGFWGRRLREVVSDAGSVDLDALRADRDALDQYVGWNAVHGPESDGWRLTDDDRRLAWMLNTLNAMTLWAALDGPAPSNPYPKLRFELDGELVRLDRLVHHGVMATYEEPTAIAGVFCFAEGCPPMRRSLYEKKGLDAALDDQMRRWTRDGLVRVDRSTLVFSSILRPWIDDFRRWSALDGPCAVAGAYAEDEVLRITLTAGGTCNFNWE